MLKKYARIEGSVVKELLSTDADIGELFSADLMWVSCPTDVEVGWAYVDQAFSAPPALPQEEIIARNSLMRDGLINYASMRIAPLQDAVDLDKATPAEVAALSTWKQYRVDVNRADLSVDAVQWPAVPT